jgi:hypothetical protein
VAVEATNAGVAILPLLHFAFRRVVRPLGFEPRGPKATVFEAAAYTVPPGAQTWWAWRDSNSHVRRRQFLRLVCMQFHHRPMALRGRFEQPIVGLEATCVTIRIRSTLVGRAGFEPARFSRRVTGATAQRLRPLTHLPDVKELTRIRSLAEGWRVERQSPEGTLVQQTSRDCRYPKPSGPAITNTITMRVDNWTGRSNRACEFLLRCP